MKEKQNRIGRMLTLIRKVSKQANRILISNRKESNYSRNMCSNLISSSDNNRSTVLQVLRPVAATDNFKSIDEMRPKLLHICRDYLFGDWKSMPLKSYGFQHVSGGLSNWLYHVWLPDSLDDKDIFTNNSKEEPRHVLVRIYGQTHADEQSLESLVTESVIFTLLSERGLGPKLYGIFQGGRIEEYISNGRPLRTEELSDQFLSETIAKKLAAIHEMQVPLTKEPTWLWSTMKRWLKLWHTEVKGKLVPPQLQTFLNETVDFDEEYNWLSENSVKYANTVVFCHNDLQEGNILYNENTKQLVLIDFEYCSYNYRGFDIANHFVEWTYNYTAKEYPNFIEYKNRYPTGEQQTVFIEAYLRELNQLNDQNVARVLDEVRFFSLMSHFFWSIWAMVNATKSQIPFGYWEYCDARLNAYFRLKKELLMVKKTANEPNY